MSMHLYICLNYRVFVASGCLLSQSKKASPWRSFHSSIGFKSIGDAFKDSSFMTSSGF